MSGNTEYGSYVGETSLLPSRQSQPETEGPAVAAAPGRPLLGSVLAAWNLHLGDLTSAGRLLWGLQALATEMAKTFLYVGWVPAALGLWWFRDRYRTVPGAWVLLLVCLAQTLALVRLTVIMGYVSERHTLITVLCACIWGAAAVRLLGQRLGAWLGARFALRGLATDGRVWAVALLLAWAGAGLPASLRPLHANRAGHHAAGLWLAEHAGAADYVYDPFCWAHYYAGCVFCEGASPGASAGHEPTVFVVLEDSHNPHSRLPLIPFGQEVRKHATAVYHWSPSSRAQVKERAEPVSVYALPRALYEQLVAQQREKNTMCLP
jgi:hypothetical protein